MDFVIQVGNPIVLDAKDQHVKDLSEAIQTIFPMNTEDAFLLWNRVPVKINYEYDLSILIDDLMLLLTNLLSIEKGLQRVYWGSDTFSAEWIIYWDKDQLIVTTRWDNIAGNYKELLNSRSRLEIDRNNFLREWKMLLNKTIESLDKSGVYIENQGSLTSLRKIEASIPTFGYLYSIEENRC